MRCGTCVLWSEGSARICSANPQPNPQKNGNTYLFQSAKRLSSSNSKTFGLGWVSVGVGGCHAANIQIKTQPPTTKGVSLTMLPQIYLHALAPGLAGLARIVCGAGSCGANVLGNASVGRRVPTESRQSVQQFVFKRFLAGLGGSCGSLLGATWHLIKKIYRVPLFSDHFFPNLDWLINVRYVNVLHLITRNTTIRQPVLRIDIGHCRRIQDHPR